MPSMDFQCYMYCNFICDALALQGLKNFASKLPAERAEAFAAELEAAAAAAGPDEAADAWQPYYVLLDQLRDRAVKVAFLRPQHTRLV